MKRFLLVSIVLGLTLHANFSYSYRKATIEECYTCDNDKLTILYETPIIPLKDVVLSNEFGFREQLDFSPTFVSATYENNCDFPTIESAILFDHGNQHDNSQIERGSLAISECSSYDHNFDADRNFFKPDPDDVRQKMYEAECLKNADTYSSPQINVLSFESKQYNVSEQACCLLDLHNISSTNFISHRGTIEQQKLHEELIFIIEQAASLDACAVDSEFVETVYTVNSYVVPMTDIAREYNGIGETVRGWMVANWCSKALSCTKAIVLGATIGAVEAVTHLCTHPIQTILWITLPKYMLAYVVIDTTWQLLPVASHVANTFAQNYHDDKSFLENSLLAIENISCAIQAYGVEISTEDVLKATAATIAQIAIERKLFSRLGQLYQKAQNYGSKFIAEEIAYASAMNAESHIVTTAEQQQLFLAKKATERRSLNNKAKERYPHASSVANCIPIDIRSFGEGRLAYMFNGKKMVAYQDGDRGNWWSVDLSKHGGSCYKVFNLEGHYLHWLFDADQWGNIVFKNKGDKGLVVRVIKFYN